MTKLDKIIDLTNYYMTNMLEEPDVIREALSAYFAGMNEDNLNEFLEEVTE